MFLLENILAKTLAIFVDDDSRLPFLYLIAQGDHDLSEH